LGEIDKPVSVDCKVIGVIEKRKDNRCFWEFPKKMFSTHYLD
jgi:hypothetical protein